MTKKESAPHSEQPFNEREIVGGTPETVTPGHETADVGTTRDKIKDALRDQQRLRARVDQETETLRQSRIALSDADKKVHNLVHQLLEETLGSAYDARVVLYQMTGRRQ